MQVGPTPEHTAYLLQVDLINSLFHQGLLSFQGAAIFVSQCWGRSLSWFLGLTDFVTTAHAENTLAPETGS